MAGSDEKPAPSPQRPVRWWPGILIGLLGVAAVAWVRSQADWPFQKRNLTAAQVASVTGILLLVWWTFFSRAPNRLRLLVTYSTLALCAVAIVLFRIRGVSGDMLPILEFRWAAQPALAVTSPTNSDLTIQRFNDSPA